MAREVLSIDNKEVLDDIKEIILKGTGHHAPCRMNFSEVKQHLQASEKRFDAGEYISEELTAVMIIRYDVKARYQIEENPVLSKSVNHPLPTEKNNILPMPPIPFAVHQT